MLLNEEFPQDHYIKLEGNDFHIGQLTLNKLNQTYSVEINIVQKESKKIYIHIDIIYNMPSVHEALDAAVQRLADYLTKQS